MDNEPRIIELPKIKDLRGNLSFLEDNNHIPFKIKRAYWIYDIPGGEERGSHAYRNASEFVILLSGGFTVKTIRGEEERNFQLDKANFGLFLPPYTWRKFSNFLSNSICLVVSDTNYKNCEDICDYNDYYNEFVQKKL